MAPLRLNIRLIWSLYRISRDSALQTASPPKPECAAGFGPFRQKLLARSFAFVKLRRQRIRPKPFGATAGKREFPNPFLHSIRRKSEGMTKLAVSMKNRRPSETPSSAAMGGDEFVRAFNDCRAELVSTLYYMLGNRDDAQDVAQDAFIKCWRTRSTLTDVRNMR